MKTKEELNVLKNEISAINDKLAELSEDELKEVTGGSSACLPNQQRRKPDIKYMILTKSDNNECDTRKDHYENIILGD